MPDKMSDDSKRSSIQRPSPGPFVSIPVSDVLPARNPLPETTSLAALHNLLRKPQMHPGLMNDLEKFAHAGDLEAAGWLRQLRESVSLAVEAHSQFDDHLVAEVTYHPVMSAAHLAFQEHRPLVFSPDIVWLMISQGFANHIRANSAALRSRLACHEGRISLRVRRDDFIKGSPENSWPEVFTAFESQVAEHLGPEAYHLLRPDFSSTGPVERAVGSIVLLDAVQAYFSFDCITACGIPEVVLEGTPGDWERLAARTQNLGRFELEWWTTALQPILTEFIRAVTERPDRDFWQSLYKVDSASGGPFATGWLVAFFPYLWDLKSGSSSRRNPLFRGNPVDLPALLHPNSARPREARVGLVKTQELPSGISSAPFGWQCLDKRFEMDFLGGFTGVAQERETLRLRPEIGWAVREAAASGGR